MLDLSLTEAQLFRILTGFFGGDQVVFKMSAWAVCGAALPAELADSDGSLERWARSNHCLFTIVDNQDRAVMVVEFFSGFADSIEVRDVEHQQFLRPLLKAAGIKYVTISADEFAEITDPRSTLDFFSLLQAKIGEDVDYARDA